MPDVLEGKYLALREIIGRYDKVAVAFSGGVDSTLLLAAAREVLGENVVAITNSTYLNPDRETKESLDFCRDFGIRHIVLAGDELAIPGFSENPTNRCYLCKRHLFDCFKKALASEGISVIFEGSNVDDDADFRPGSQAVREHGILSPLREAGLTKQDIRDLSQQMGLPTWQKPSFACLASRFPYGCEITREGLARVDAAEQYLIDRGFAQVRVRVHGDVARIEVPADQIEALFKLSRNGDLSRVFKDLGFTHVALDLDGYHTGSMNAGIV